MNNEQKISDMLRVTVNNSVTFYMQLADHIDRLEQTIERYREKFGDIDNDNVQE